MSATAFLAKLHAAGVTVHADGDQLRLDAPRGGLTPEMRSAVKSCKAELLEILKSPKGLSAGESLFSPNAPGTQVHFIETLTQTSAEGETYADREFARFEQVAVPMLGGTGWFDPTQAPVPVGVSGEQWGALIVDFARLGKAVRPKSPDERHGILE